MLRGVGGADGRKVQGHLDAIRDIEKQITTAVPISVDCRAPGRPVDPDVRDRNTIPRATRLHALLPGGLQAGEEGRRDGQHHGPRR
jgi:hypothetical protein